MKKLKGLLRLLRGVQDIILDVQQGRHPPIHTLVDVTEIQELNALEVRGDEVFIGAGVSHKRINSSQIINKHCKALGIASASNLGVLKFAT